MDIDTAERKDCNWVGSLLDMFLLGREILIHMLGGRTNKVVDNNVPDSNSGIEAIRVQSDKCYREFGWDKLVRWTHVMKSVGNLALADLFGCSDTN